MVEFKQPRAMRWPKERNSIHFYERIVQSTKHGMFVCIANKIGGPDYFVFFFAAASGFFFSPTVFDASLFFRAFCC